MPNLSNVGRLFLGIAIAVFGLLTIFYHEFPYMLFPPNHVWITGHVILTYILGVLFIVAGTSFIFKKKIRSISLLLGTALLMIFCFYFIPYQFTANSNYLHFGTWENAEKELALSGGAFVIAGCFSDKNENSFFNFLSKLIALGAILFSLTIICFGVDHFLYAKSVSDYVPSWVPMHIFWTYFAGIALIGSGIAIILKIKMGLIATLLGTMIFIWFIILHIPRVIVSSYADLGDEIASAVLALAYSGIAFVIAGSNTRRIQ